MHVTLSDLWFRIFELIGVFLIPDVYEVYSGTDGIVKAKGRVYSK